MKRATVEKFIEFTDYLRAGMSHRAAAKEARISRKTVWLMRRASPELQALLYEAERHGAENKTFYRDQYFENKLQHLIRKQEVARKVWNGRLTHRMKKVIYRWQGKWPRSQLPTGDDPFAQTAADEIHEQQQAGFAKRRRERHGDDAPPESSRPGIGPMTPRQAQQFLQLVTDGWNVASAARKIGLHKDDVIAQRAADPEFARLLVEAMEAGEGAFSGPRQGTWEPPKKTGRAGPLF